MIKSLVTGLVAGIVFRLLNLPIPAPNTLEGVLGIVGLFIGYMFYIEWK